MTALAGNREHLGMHEPHKARMGACRFILPFAFALFIAGCSGVVEITEPQDANAPGGGYTGATAPITQFVVKVNNNYAGNFSADLDGVPITSWFTPAAAPNNTVVAQVPSCFSGGTQITPSIRFKHELVARADSTNPSLSIDNDIAEFVPPSLQFQPSVGINISRGQTVSVLMNLTSGQVTNVPVTLEPNHPTVSVNGAPSGTAAPGVIPNNNVGSFTITGVAPGSFIIMVKARGVQCGGVSGFVR
jgi:hypothetical protein